MCQFDNAIKNYMDYRTVTDTTSKQYSIISQSYVSDNGLMYYDNHVLVALGSYYGEVGSKYKITLENGNQVNVIKADEKSNAHVISGCYHESNNSILEFIVDTNKLPSIASQMGNIGVLKEFEGKIIKIEKEN